MLHLVNELACLFIVRFINIIHMIIHSAHIKRLLRILNGIKIDKTCKDSLQNKTSQKNGP